MAQIIPIPTKHMADFLLDVMDTIEAIEGYSERWWHYSRMLDDAEYRRGGIDCEKYYQNQKKGG